MLQVHIVAIEMIREVKPLIDRIARHDRSLAKQVRESASSVALNIGEGARSIGGHERERFGTAAGSASETRSALEVAAAWGYIKEHEREPVDDKLDRIAATLWRLTHRS